MKTEIYYCYFSQNSTALKSRALPGDQIITTNSNSSSSFSFVKPLGALLDPDVFINIPGVIIIFNNFSSTIYICRSIVLYNSLKIKEEKKTQ